MPALTLFLRPTQLKLCSVVRRKIVKLEQGSQLVISLAESVDSGEYSCQVSALDKAVLTHHVNVRGERELSARHRNKPGLSWFYSVFFCSSPGKQSLNSAGPTLALADYNANMTKTFLVCSGKTFTGKWKFLLKIIYESPLAV